MCESTVMITKCFATAKQRRSCDRTPTAHASIRQIYPLHSSRIILASPQPACMLSFNSSRGGSLKSLHSWNKSKWISWSLQHKIVCVCVWVRTHKSSLATQPHQLQFDLSREGKRLTKTASSRLVFISCTGTIERTIQSYSTRRTR